jgi:hypothetical protein
MMKKLSFFVLALVLVTSISCRKKELIPGVYEGAERTMGNGTVRSWVKFDRDGVPLSLGFTLTDDALTGLATSAAGHDHNNSYDFMLPPTEVSRTPFDHIVIDWNPSGHEPKPIYAAGHFDFHFYMIDNKERRSIPSYSQDSTGFKNKPSAEYFPANYINPPLVVSSDPQMGTHWVDMNSPELQPGGVFTETFVYGSYNGKVNFLEPMVTMDFFKSITNFSRSIPWPAKVQISGYYPKTLRITHVDGEYILALEDLQHRVAQ